MAARLSPARANSGCEVLAHSIGNEKLCVLRPSIRSLDEPNLVLTQGLAVRRRCVLLMGGSIADMAVQNDEGRTALGVVKNIQGVTTLDTKRKVMVRSL